MPVEKYVPFAFWIAFVALAMVNGLGAPARSAGVQIAKANFDNARMR